MLKLLSATDPQLVPVEIHYDPETQLPSTAEGSETATFWIRALTAAEMTRAIDRSVSLDKKGRERKSLFRMSRDLLLAAVVRVDGLTTAEGQEVTKLTQASYDALPAWVSTRLADRMAEINGLSEDEAGN